MIFFCNVQFVTRILRDRLSELVNEGIHEHGLRGLARELNVDIGPLRSIRDGKDVHLSTAVLLLERFGLEAEVFPSGSKPVSAIGFAEAVQEYVRPSLDGSPEALEHGYLPIPFHRADLVHRDLSQLAFARSWIEDQGLDAEHLNAIFMPNDDMWPAINPGDLLLIDGTFKPELEPTLCAFTVGDAIKVGWLTVPKAGCLVGLFQRSFTPPVVRAGKSGARIECLGRVVARLDAAPGPWIDATEKRRMIDHARQIANVNNVS